MGIDIYGVQILIREEVRGACEILGLAPLYVAIEGKCIVIVSPQAAEQVLEAMKHHPKGKKEPSSVKS